MELKNMSEKHKKAEKQEKEKKKEVKLQKVRVKAPPLKEQFKRQRKTVIAPDLQSLAKESSFLEDSVSCKAEILFFLCS